MINHDKSDVYPRNARFTQYLKSIIIYHVNTLKKKTIYIIFSIGTQKSTKINVYPL